MTPIPRLGATLITLLLALLLAAVPASAAPRAAGGNDTTGESGADGYDIDRADVTLDDQTGALSATISLAGEIAPDAYVQANFADLAGGSCPIDAQVALGGAFAGGPSEWAAADGTTGTGEAVAVSGATVRVAATVPAAAPRTCVRFIAGPNGGSPVDVTGYLELTPVASPTPTPPAPTPTPAPPTTPPAPTPAPTPAKPAPQLRATLKGIPARVKRGQRIRPTLTVANRGNAASKALTVRIKSARGLSVKPRTVKVKALAPGKAKRVKLRVSLSRKARSATPFVVSAKGGGLTATARKTLRLKAKPKPKPKPTTPAQGGLPGTFWWWNEFTANTPFNVFSLRFYGNGYAYYRLPNDGESVPERCDSVTSVPDEDGEYGPGCVKWELKGNQLTFSDPRFTGTFENGKLSIRDAEKAYDVDRLAEPPAGKRFNFSYKNIETTGICGPFSYCSNTQSYLTLQEDGQFGLQEESNSSLDTGGSFTYAGSYPPESRGTYEVLSGYRIRLSYADGKTEIVPFGIVEGTSAVDSNVRVIVGRLPFWIPDEND